MEAQNEEISSQRRFVDERDTHANPSNSPRPRTESQGRSFSARTSIALALIAAGTGSFFVEPRPWVGVFVSTVFFIPGIVLCRQEIRQRSESPLLIFLATLASISVVISLLAYLFTGFLVLSASQQAAAERQAQASVRTAKITVIQIGDWGTAEFPPGVTFKEIEAAIEEKWPAHYRQGKWRVLSD